MNSKERMLAVLSGCRADLVPAAPEWWGNYKFEIAGLDYLLDSWRDGAGLVPVYEAFHRRFQPDWYELHSGTPRAYRSYQVVREEGNLYLLGPGYRAEICPDGRLRGPDCRAGKARGPIVDLSSRRAINAFLAREAEWTAERLAEEGYVDHVREIVRRHGDTVFVAVMKELPGLLSSPTDEDGFVNGLMGLYDHPENVRYLIERRYSLRLEWVRAFAEAGAHAFIACEDLAGADIIGPRVYEQFLFPVHQWFFAEVERLGLVPMIYYCGDIVPLLEYLKQTALRGLMPEEGRKTFALDIVEIAHRLEGSMCLFGNVDTVEVLWRGTPADVEAAVEQQMQAAAYGPFVVRNGSPIAPGTPPENVEALIRAARLATP